MSNHESGVSEEELAQEAVKPPEKKVEAHQPTAAEKLSVENKRMAVEMVLAPDKFDISKLSETQKDSVLVELGSAKTFLENKMNALPENDVAGRAKFLEKIQRADTAKEKLAKKEDVHEVADNMIIESKPVQVPEVVQEVSNDMIVESVPAEKATPEKQRGFFAKILDRARGNVVMDENASTDKGPIRGSDIARVGGESLSAKAILTEARLKGRNVRSGELNPGSSPQSNSQEIVHEVTDDMIVESTPVEKKRGFFAKILDRARGNVVMDENASTDKGPIRGSDIARVGGESLSAKAILAEARTKGRNVRAGELDPGAARFVTIKGEDGKDVQMPALSEAPKGGFSARFTKAEAADMVSEQKAEEPSGVVEADIEETRRVEKEVIAEAAELNNPASERFITVQDMPAVRIRKEIPKPIDFGTAAAEVRAKRQFVDLTGTVKSRTVQDMPAINLEARNEDIEVDNQPEVISEAPLEPPIDLAKRREEVRRQKEAVTKEIPVAIYKPVVSAVGRQRVFMPAVKINPEDQSGKKAA
ncbi:MAG: hypothetical protein WCJ29_05575 [bacterium]